VFKVSNWILYIAFFETAVHIFDPGELNVQATRFNRDGKRL